MKIWILILSWPWALFGSRLLIITTKLIFVIWQDVLSIPNGNLEGKALSFEIWEHCSGKTNWKSYFFLENQQHIYHQGIFFLFNSVFKKVLKSTKIAFTNNFLLKLSLAGTSFFIKLFFESYGFIRKNICIH